MQYYDSHISVGSIMRIFTNTFRYTYTSISSAQKRLCCLACLIFDRGSRSSVSVSCPHVFHVDEILELKLQRLFFDIREILESEFSGSGCQPTTPCECHDPRNHVVYTLLRRSHLNVVPIPSSGYLSSNIFIIHSYPSADSLLRFCAPSSANQLAL